MQESPLFWRDISNTYFKKVDMKEVDASAEEVKQSQKLICWEELQRCKASNNSFHDIDDITVNEFAFDYCNNDLTNRKNVKSK